MTKTCAITVYATTITLVASGIFTIIETGTAIHSGRVSS
jgi:hypothetical protein